VRLLRTGLLVCGGGFAICFGSCEGKRYGGDGTGLDVGQINRIRKGLGGVAGAYMEQVAEATGLDLKTVKALAQRKG
jgi:hypothetical protein